MELLKKLRAIKKMIKSYLAQEIKITSVLAIKVSAHEVFNFIADPSNWITLGLHSINSITYDRGLWNFESERGPGNLFIETNRSNYILNYSILFLHEDIYEVMVSITNQGDACLLIISIVKPEKMPVEYFEYRLEELDEAFVCLKRIMEANAHSK